jgi:hypothetical protein
LVHLWSHFVSAVSTEVRSSPDRLIRAICKILVSRISIWDGNCLEFQSEPYWSMSAVEILAVIQSLNSNFCCVEQKCIVAWSLRRLIMISVYKPILASSSPSYSKEDSGDATLLSICVEDVISFLISTISMVSNLFT